MAQHYLSMVDSGSTLVLKQGDTLSIQLDENPTTGYRWSEPASTLDGVVQLASEFVPSEVSALGAGGQRRFLLQTKQPGKTTLQLKHWQDWEGEASVLERFTLTLQTSE